MASDPQFTTNDPRFGTNPNQYDQTYQNDEPRKRNPWKTCVLGCLIMAAVLLLVAVIGGFWAARHIRGWFANVGAQAINQAVDSSELPAQEKVEVKEQVERVTKAFGEGRISVDQAKAIVEKLTQSPLMPTFVVMAVEKNYFEKSKLTDAEKADGRKVLKRFARGAFDHKIDEKGVDSVLKHIADRGPKNQWHFRPQVSDADLKAAISDAKAQADEANIPDVPENIDPSDEIKRIIDESLNQQQ
jgi:hypothetical protein